MKLKKIDILLAEHRRVSVDMPGAKLPDLIDAVVANWNRRAEPKPEEGNA